MQSRRATERGEVDGGDFEPEPGPVVVSTRPFARLRPPAPDDRDGAGTEARLGRLEAQNRRLKLAMLALVVAFTATLLVQLYPDVVVRQQLLESQELKLLDENGTPRLFLRMYSGVPVLQLLDRAGQPRMSMGLRFDDAPFLDLADENGQTRAVLELDDASDPVLQLFDSEGATSFRIR